MVQEREPGVSLVLYHLFKWLVVSPMLHSYFRGKIYGAEHVPTRGPVVIASNHASNFDPVLVANCIRRPIAFMAKEELFQVPILSTLIRLYGAYPVKRGAADRSALRSAQQALEAGWAVGIFLEGTRTPDGRIHDPKLGAALIAAKMQVPLVPISLWGTEGILVNGNVPQSVPVTIRIGPPLAPPASTDRPELERVTQTCTDAINQLHALGR
jgi:1-acyl-sn-glycerol-3-phosphate acyltransferase